MANNEMKDFVDAFAVGWGLMDKRADRKFLREKEANDLKIATDKAQSLAIQNQRKSNEFDINQQRLQDVAKATQGRFDTSHDFAVQRAGVADTHFTETNRIARAAEARQSAADARAAATAAQVAKEKQLKDNPTLILGEPSGATTTDVATPEQAVNIGEAPAAAATSSPAPPVATSAVDTSAAPGRTGKVSSTLGTAVDVAGAAVPNTQPIAAALHSGLTYLQDHFGLNQGVDAGGAPTDGQKRMIEGEGTPTPEAMDRLKKVLGHDTGMKGRLEHTDVLLKTYQKFLELGRPDDAAKAAASLIQYSRGVSAMLGSTAEQKARNGDMVGATKDVVEAYNQIPDGNSVTYDAKAGRFKIVEDKTGDTVYEGPVTPQEILSMADGFKTGKAYWQILMDAAQGGKDLKGTGTSSGQTDAQFKAGQATTVEDPNAPPQHVADANTAMGSFLQNMKGPGGTPMFEGKTDEQIAQAITPEGVDGLHKLAEMVALQNNIPGPEAAKLAFAIADPTTVAVRKASGDRGDSTVGDERWGFRLIGGDANKTEIALPNGRRLILPTREFAPAVVAANSGLLALHSGANQAYASDQAGIAQNQAARDAATAAIARRDAGLRRTGAIRRPGLDLGQVRAAAVANQNAPGRRLNALRRPAVDLNAEDPYMRLSIPRG